MNQLNYCQLQILGRNLYIANINLLAKSLRLSIRLIYQWLCMIINDNVMFCQAIKTIEWNIEYSYIYKYSYIIYIYNIAIYSYIQLYIQNIVIYIVIYSYIYSARNKYKLYFHSMIKTSVFIWHFGRATEQIVSFHTNWSRERRS